jgi:mannose-1-phosphate guanylyltransferase
VQKPGECGAEYQPCSRRPDLRALLLAAGLGTRLRPLTHSIPKCLVQVQGRALLDYWLDHLLADGTFERVLINTHYFADRVRDHIAASRWAARVDLTHEVELLGTGGTVKANRAYFGSQSFLVAHADNLTTFDKGEFLADHFRRPSDCLMTMLTFRADNPTQCGVLELDGRGVVVGFHEKVANPPGNLANAAVYMLAPEALDFVVNAPGSVIDLSTQIIPRLVGSIFTVENRGYHRDIGTIESLQRANADLANLS